MPYELRGKCVYNKETGKKKGCSSSVKKAKAYMRALYASEPINEGLSDAVLDRANDVYSAMKADDKAIMNAVAKHGSSAENILWGRAINTAKKQVQTMSDTKLKEIIKKKLSTPPVSEKKFPDLTGDGKVTKADILKGRGVELKEEVDYEGEMAKSELYRLVKNSQELMQMLDDDTQLEAWVQSKITKAADYIASVSQYLNFQAENRPSVDERTEYTLNKQNGE
jgi:hypothetical protein